MSGESDGKSLESGERAAGLENAVHGGSREDEVRLAPSATSVQTQQSGLYDVPSRRLSLLVEGRDYLKYRETFERLLFSEKMTPAHKDARILKLAMTCLIEKMDAVSAETGEPFVKAEMLAG